MENISRQDLWGRLGPVSDSILPVWGVRLCIFWTAEVSTYRAVPCLETCEPADNLTWIFAGSCTGWNLYVLSKCTVLSYLVPVNTQTYTIIYTLHIHSLPSDSHHSPSHFTVTTSKWYKTNKWSISIMTLFGPSACVEVSLHLRNKITLTDTGTGFLL